MSKFKLWVAKTFFNDLMSLDETPKRITEDASTSKSAVIAPIKRVGLRAGDTTSKDFESPEFDLAQIYDGYNTDSYIRQGVDKYIDQIFKEGFEFVGPNQAVNDYIKLRFAYIAEATGVPTAQLFIDISEDVVKYSNCVIAKSRAADASSIPQGVNVTGINGLQPVVGYFCLNAPSMTMKRDKNGTVTSWQQTMEGTEKPLKFKAEDIIHIPYKKEKGNAFGTSFLIPVLDDVRALRQAEENVLRMMYRNIYPFYHAAVGDKDLTGTDNEINTLKDTFDNMDLDGGMVTTNRVEIKPIASNQVINAEPYLKYLEQRVFSGLDVPAIMFGRGDTANRSTGDSMVSEMDDRIRAIKTVIEMYINSFMIKELLMEGGFDPILNPDQNTLFNFKDNDLDAKIKKENNAIFKYEHNAITEDEMRIEIGMDLIVDRAKMHQTLITQANLTQANGLTMEAAAAASNDPNATASKVSTGTKKGSGQNGTSTPSGSKATNNKQQPTNQSGTKTSPKKLTNSLLKGLTIDFTNDLNVEIKDYVDFCRLTNVEVSSDVVIDMTEYGLKTLDVLVNEFMVDSDPDKEEIVGYFLDMYSVFQEDLVRTLISSKDYSEMNNVIEASISLMKTNLSKLV